ncbi:MAG: cobalamin biosynthesis protein CbiG [Lachnospiraceae bacterium]|jgi:cobalt-precorrin 5A hydrolase|nr:cobalamin biosynthesis protein CbiG [Lachnospiraceae bacterium]
MEIRQKTQETKASVISFTETGSCLAEKVKIILEAYQNENQNGKVTVELQESRKLSGSLKEWCKASFVQCQLLIFVGAVGIAVRLIAEFIRDKYQDPAVLVVDELGNYVIPILSGHVGGGNAWAAFLAYQLEAVPVITTATDLHGKFAVDVFAANNGLTISERTLAKEISAAVLRGEKIRFFCEKTFLGKLPKDLIFSEEFAKDVKRQEPKYKIYLGIHHKKEAHTLCLHPKSLVLGIGCKQGKTLKEIEDFVSRRFEEEQLAWDSICAMASIDLKEKENSLLEFCDKWNIPFYTFSAEQLGDIPGDFAESEFVKRTVGVGNVCERAAVGYAMRYGSRQKYPLLVLHKVAGDGITLAVAELDWSVKFE